MILKGSKNASLSGKGLKTRGQCCSQIRLCRWQMLLVNIGLNTDDVADFCDCISLALYPAASCDKTLLAICKQCSSRLACAAGQSGLRATLAANL